MTNITKTDHTVHSIRYVEYRKDGLLHNDYGPAYEMFYENGKQFHKSYYLDGKKLSYKTWLRKTNPWAYEYDRCFIIDGKKYKICHVSDSSGTVTLKLFKNNKWYGDYD